MWETGRGAAELAGEMGLSQISDEGAVLEWVRQALAANPQAVADLKSGKGKAVGALVGAVMKFSKGKANPALVNKMIEQEVAR
jgi:aspartyl-tRNA(Asn)/glutamyl-tRNA(Gln) amidotransferase subunit B